MTQVTGTYDKYDLTGIREDLSNVIYNIDPTEVPVISMMSRGKAKNTKHEWQTDGLAAASGSNAQIEGDQFSYSDPTATTRLDNQTQIFRKTVLVSGTARAVDTAGREDELGYQLAKMGKEIKRDIETSVCQNVAKVTGNSSTARKLAGIPTWLKTNSSEGSGGADPTGDGSDTRTDGTQRAFTEALLKTVLQSCYTNGADVKVAVVGAFNKQKFSEFSGNATRFDKSEDKKLTAAIDVYISDFGELKVIPCRQSRSRDCLLLDPEFLSLAVLREMQTIEPAITSDATPRVMLTELTSKMHNEKAHGIVADLTTS
jgi:hypothetical protein